MESGGVVLSFVWGVVAATASGTSYEIPEEITFQVYVAFDNVLHTHFSNTNRATQYTSVFFNAINLHFRKMQNPRIKFEVVMFHSQYIPFTKLALTLDDSKYQLDATSSLGSLYNFTRTKIQFEPSDIVFVFSGLGAPSACTPNFGKLEGNFMPFVLTDCAMDAIRKFLQNIVKNDPYRAKECFRRRYQLSISQYYNGLPSSMVDEEEFCKSSEKFAEDYRRRGRCENEYIKPFLGDYHLFLESRGHPADPGPCYFDCCSVKLDGLTYPYQLMRYFAFDGKPCGPRKDQICVLSQCANITTST
uniref:Putative secreted protein n=1 Tax=Ornithodoros turicata TaxID=34597 RepID=A0A2R5LJN9_9ACAR